MDSFEIDNIQIEKAQAIRRFNRTQNLKKLLFLSSEVLVALFSISWLSKRTPDGLKIAGDLFSAFVLVLERPMSCFLLVNLLVLVILVLSSRKSNSPDIYEEYAGSNTAEEKLTEDPAAEEGVMDKEIIVVENAAIEKETVTVAEETESECADSSVEQDAMITVTETDGAFSGETVTELKRDFGVEVKRKGYGRSRSEISDNYGHKTRLELRRSGSAIGGEMVVAGRTEARKSVEDLSNEEFRLRIEKFIAEKNKSLFQEYRDSIYHEDHEIEV